MPSDPAPELERDSETADLDRDERRESQVARNARSWWQPRRVEPEVRDQVLGQLFQEGDRRRPYLYRFALLQALSVIIAVVGVLGGSAAIVIGAMLLAPLMTPVLALAAALVMVWPRRAGRSAFLVLAASVGSVLLAWLVAAALPQSEPTIPFELLSRTSPTLLDLVVALAAGAAGGYSLVREDVGTTLPGVAIAVALVPPLAVAGAALDLGRGDLAAGAVLLYATNLAAIVLAGGVVYLATGFIPAVRVARLGARVIATIAVTAVCVTVLAVPLTRSLLANLGDERVTSVALDEVLVWIGDRDLEVVEVAVDGDAIVVDLIGSEAPPDIGELGRRLDARLDRPVTVTVRWVERQVLVYPEA